MTDVVLASNDWEKLIMIQCDQCGQKLLILPFIWEAIEMMLHDDNGES